MLIKESGPVFLYVRFRGSRVKRLIPHYRDIRHHDIYSWLLLSLISETTGVVSFLADNKQLDVADAIYGIGLISDGFLL